MRYGGRVSRRTVLISGAGIAGPTLAYWLARSGFATTVVDQSRGARSSGGPVDVRGEAVDVARAMGVMPHLMEAATRVRELRIVDGGGRVVATMDLSPSRRASAGEEVEIVRSRLAAILTEAAQADVEFLFSDSLQELRQDPAGVDVTLASGRRGRFDLVVGADGLHSNVRRLAIAPEADVVRHLGLFVAGFPLPEPVHDPRVVVMYNTPGRSVAIHPAGGDPVAAFIFRRAAQAGPDYRDPARQKRIVTDAYEDAGWRVPQLLERLRAAGDLYLDGVCRVHLGRWSSGRVVLVGDAASCVSLFGEGSSMAMVGARTLARTLAETPDHTLAFKRYEAIHRTAAGPKQRGASIAARILVPATRPGIALRNLALRTAAGPLWPSRAER